MLSTLLVWLVWLFLFIPVIAWLLGFLVYTPAKETDGDGASGAPKLTEADPKPDSFGAGVI
jgi:hypothetical protein